MSMIDPDNSRVTYSVKGLLAEIRDDVKQIDAKLDTKVSREDFHALERVVVALKTEADKASGRDKLLASVIGLCVMFAVALFAAHGGHIF